MKTLAKHYVLQFAHTAQITQSTPEKGVCCESLVAVPCPVALKQIRVVSQAVWPFIAQRYFSH
jgi:hypothetical protein